LRIRGCQVDLSFLILLTFSFILSAFLVRAAAWADQIVHEIVDKLYKPSENELSGYGRVVSDIILELNTCGVKCDYLPIVQ
jgi:hypothetical protein